MLVTPAGIFSEVSPANQNTVVPRVFTLSGMVKDVNFLQSWKAEFPIVVRVGVPSKVNVVNSEQLEKALAPMVFTETGTAKDVNASQLLKALDPIVVSAGVPAKVTVARLLLYWNAHCSISVTLSGMVMPVSFE